jgi:hypothetical protein
MSHTRETDRSVGHRSTAPDQSEADRAGSEADRSASLDDQADSTADRRAAMEDQAISDEDQVTADLQHDAARNLSAQEERAYLAARDHRHAVSLIRGLGQRRRERTAILRRGTAALRDMVMRPRLRSAAIRRRLIAEGDSSEIAVRWCDAWESEAARQGLRHDPDYWNRGSHWIWAERAAGHTP